MLHGSETRLVKKQIELTLQRDEMTMTDTIQYSPKVIRYMQQVFPWAHPRPQPKRHLDCFSRFCTAHKVTDRLTD